MKIKPVKPKKNRFKALESTFMGQAYNKLKRKLRAPSHGVEAPKTKKKNRMPILQNLKIFKKFQTYILISLAVLFLGSIFLNILQYLSIKPTNFNDSVITNQEDISGNQINIIYLGFEDSDSYLFLNNIVVQSLNSKTGKVKHLLIDPKFTYKIDGFQNTFTFKTMFNSLQVPNEDKLSELLSALQNFIGIRVDRYVAFKYSDMKSYIIENNSESKIIDDSFSGTKRTYSKGDKIKGEELNNYLFNDKDLIEAKPIIYRRFMEFLNNNIEQNSNYFNMYKLFWKSSELVKIFYTNLSRDELFYVSRIMNSADYPIESEFISTENSLKDANSIDNGFVADQVLIDEKVSKFFRDVEVLKEQAKIEIYNGSGLSGLAYYYKRLYENSGSKVVKYGNYNQEREKTIVYITKTDVKSLNNTIDMVKRSFDFDVDVTTEGYNENYSGDIIIILGKDLGLN